MIRPRQLDRSISYQVRSEAYMRVLSYAGSCRAAPPLQKQPAARPKVLAQTRPSAKRDHGAYDKSKRVREFQDSWLGEFNYLRYDKKANIMYCEPCREFAHIHPNSEVAMIKGMFSLLKKKL